MCPEDYGAGPPSMAEGDGAGVRVLKPPGGGSSDIFGSNEAVDGAVPRRVVRGQASSVGGVLSQEELQPTPVKKGSGSGMDSHSRLFGPGPDSAPALTKNRMKSNIFLGGEAQINGHHEMNGSTDLIDHSNGHGAVVGGPGVRQSAAHLPIHDDIMHPHRRASCRKPDGNPVTGNGYENGNGSMSSNSSVNGGGSSNGSINGSNGHSGRARVPPGGFSSGLW